MPPSAGSEGRSIPALKLAMGVRVLFCPVLAEADRAFPSVLSLRAEAEYGAGEDMEKCEVRLDRG